MLVLCSWPKIGNENSARSFSDRSFSEPPWGHGRPRLRVMDVRTEMHVFPGFRGLDRSFCPRTSAGISAWTSAGDPAPELTLWADFLFLNLRDRTGRTKTTGSCHHPKPIPRFFFRAISVFTQASNGNSYQGDLGHGTEPPVHA